MNKEYSQLLYQEVDKAFASNMDAALISRCVSGAADILFLPEGKKVPTLHRCIMNGHMEALKAILATQRVVDFTARDMDWNSFNPLHRVAALGRTADVKKAMLATIIRRLASHPNDRVDWSQTSNGGSDFLALAAVNGVLSDLYPLVRELPYYKNASKPLVLTSKTRDWDWAKLSARDQSELQRPR